MLAIDNLGVRPARPPLWTVPRPADLPSPDSRPRPDHRRTPIVDAVRRYVEAGTAPFSTPGHKLGAGADPALRAILGAQVFAADAWLNSAEHARALAEAEALAADAWGADRSWFLVNGSSGGNHAFLMAALRPGDEVIVARDIHRSLLASLILVGARPVWVAPKLHPELHVGLGVDPGEVGAALDAHPNAKLVAVVGVSYWGVAADVAAIAAVAHERGVPVYVDEAWGPHLPFHPGLPVPALAAGADAAVTSAHKLLGCLGQGALLSVRGPLLDRDRVATAVRMTQTTSPSLPILASLDACRRQMALDGEALLERTIALAAAARDRLAAIPGLVVLDESRLDGAALDPTRLVIDVAGLGLSGFEVERTLRARFGVAPEMSDLIGVVCLVTIGDTAESIGRLVAAFATIAAARPATRAGRARAWLRSSGVAVAPGPQACSPREAFFASSRAVPLAAAAGEIAAEMVVPYPPGIPVLVPGEVICPEKLSYLRLGLAQGMHVCGAADPTLATIAVVAE